MNWVNEVNKVEEVIGVTGVHLMIRVNGIGQMSWTRLIG